MDKKKIATDTNALHVVLVSGQSNANGAIAALRGGPVGTYSNTYADCWFYDTDKDLGVTSRQPMDDNGRWGCELSLARMMVNRWGTNNCAVWKIAWPGTSMFVDWEPNAGYVWTWFKDHFNLAKLAFYDRPNIVIEGMVWVQGEADAGVSGWASSYSTNMVRFIGNVRTFTGVTNLPFAVYRLHTAEGDTYASTVRAAQNGLTNQSRVAVFNCDSDTMYDSQHLSNAGYHLMATNAWAGFTNFWGSP